MPGVCLRWMNNKAEVTILSRQAILARASQTGRQLLGSSLLCRLADQPRGTSNIVEHH